MRFNKISILFFAIALMYSCKKESEISSDLSPDAVKWEALNITDYDYTLQISCFCIIDYTQPKRIVVRDDKVVSIAGVPFEDLNDTSYRTINGFFEYIEKQRKLNPVVEEIEFDLEYGFPTYIYFDISEMIADEEIGYTLTDFIPY